jgi:Rod binding domain-containing protein
MSEQIAKGGGMGMSKVLEAQFSPAGATAKAATPPTHD